MKKERYMDDQLPVPERVEDLLSKMTIEEKIAQTDMIRGVELATKTHEAHFCAVDHNADFQWDMVAERIGKRGMGFVHDIYSTPKILNKLQRYFVEETRLKIPCIFTGEALHGISNPGAQIFPSPITLAATFNRELVKSVGKAIAAETRGIGIHEILAPNLDLAREPRWGRVEETFGEDTYLASEMAYAIITGEQRDGDVKRSDAVVCEPKHYLAHGFPESGRNCAPARAGEREVESCYMPVFEAGIKKAGAYNAMVSYNSIDGEPVIASDYYMKTVLKDRFGMKGYTRADFGAVNKLKADHHMTTNDEDSIKLAFENGLMVQGFDYPNELWQSTLLKLINEGKVSEETLDEAVRAILTVKFELGLFENPYTPEGNENVLRCEKHKDIAYRSAQQSVVMLKNKDNILPLKKDIKSIALIGPSSSRQRIGGYSSVPYGYEVESVRDIIGEYVGENTVINHCDGCSVSDYDISLVPCGWFKDGVDLEFYNNTDFSGEPVAYDHASQINFNWVLAKPHSDLHFKNYSVRMKARLKVNTHDFTTEDIFKGYLVFTAQDSVRVKIDGNVIIESFGKDKQPLPRAEFEFINGREYDIEVELVTDVSGNRLTLSLDYAAGSMERAAELAKDSDVIIFVGGDDTATSGEGMDRCDITLYGKQRQLLLECCKLGKPVIFVLENGKPLAIAEEADASDAILCAWFGGEFGARGICDVIFGKVNPSGKLPVSFPRSVGHLPCYYSKLPGAAVAYLEGEETALYPFGFGLSYTTFEYSNMTVDMIDRYTYHVTADITNTGDTDGDEIVQLYLNDVESSVVTSDKLLKGFERISLEAGETKTVEFVLDYDSFKIFGRDKNWTVEPGRFIIMVGSSSNDIRLEKTIEIE